MAVKERIKFFNRSVLFVALASLITACNDTSGRVEPVAVNAPSMSILAANLPRNWKGETTCSKGRESRSYAVYSTLLPIGPDTFDMIVEIPGMEGTSTIEFKLEGSNVSGTAPNGSSLKGSFINGYNDLRYSSPKRQDGLKCIVNMETE